MSRSRRKTPIFGITTSESESVDKKIWHKAYRRSAKQSKCDEPISHLEHSNVWNMSKDGKRYWKDPPKKYFRK